MKGVVRSLLLFLCTTLFIMSVSVCVCVVRVHADTTATYAVMDEFCNVIADNGTYQFQTYIKNNSSEVRAIILASDSTLTGANLYLVSENSFSRFNSNRSSSACNPEWSAGFTTVNVDSSNYAVTYTSAQPTNYINNYLIPVVIATNNQTNAIYYTFGEGSIDPAPPAPTYGLIDLEGYQTQVAGQGNASINNVDVISWNDTFDTNSNDISTGNIRVRYVPGYYRATSKQNLLAQTYQDFVLDIISAVNGDVYPVSDGSASFRWGDVIGSLSIPFYSIYNLTNSTEGWLKRGWIYEVRLEIDDYIGEWQTVFSSTSSGVENDMTIVNTTVVTQDTITAIQNINSINGTTNIWIINGQPVDPNPEVTPPKDEDEKPWWVYLLEMINNTLGIQNQYINEGTDESINVVNNFEDDHDDLNVTVNDYDDIENNIVNNMNDNLDDLDIESDLIENNGFLNSARWVAEQYTRLITNNPIGSILKFSLVLGFVMIFLGRFK